MKLLALTEHQHSGFAVYHNDGRLVCVSYQIVKD